MADINSDWLAKQGRIADNSVFGKAESSSSSEEEPDKMQGGGGGRYRAWISKNKNEMKDEQGKVDFSRCSEVFHQRISDTPEAQEFEEARDAGRFATLATRARHHNNATNHDVSVFGTVRPRAEARSQELANEKALLDDYDLRVRAATQPQVDELQLVLSYRDSLRIVSDVVVASAGSDLKQQIDVLRKLCAAAARREAREERASLQGLKDFVDQQAKVQGINFEEIPVPDLCQWKVAPDVVPVVHWQDSGMEMAQKKVAELNKAKTDLPATILDHFERISRMITFAQCDPVLEPGAGCRPSYCRRFGSGHCLCTGIGIIWDLFRRKSTSLVILMCPYQTQARRFLCDGWLVVRFGASPGRWLHIGLAYLNPRRLTYLELHPRVIMPVGRVILEAQLVNEKPEVLSEVDLAVSLDLVPPMSLRLYKLMSWETVLEPFTLGKYLVAEPLDKHFSMTENEVVFWHGKDIELADELARRKKKAAEEQAKRAKAAAKAAPTPKASPKPQPKRRPQQKPEGQGLAVLMDGAPAGPGDGQQPARAPQHVRLLVDGEEAEEDPAVCADGDADNYGGDFPGGDGMQQDWRAARAAQEVDAISGGFYVRSAPRPTLTGNP